MEHANVNVVLTMASAFVGCMAACLCAGFWLASRFNNVYKRMEEHERADIQRFADLKYLILDSKMQAQIVESWKGQTPN